METMLALVRWDAALTRPGTLAMKTWACCACDRLRLDRRAGFISITAHFCRVSRHVSFEIPVVSFAMTLVKC